MNLLIDNDWSDKHFGRYVKYINGSVRYYEIIITYHETGTPIETAKGDLYLSGYVSNEKGSRWFERVPLLTEQPVQELINYTSGKEKSRFEEDANFDTMLKTVREYLDELEKKYNSMKSVVRENECKQ